MASSRREKNVELGWPLLEFAFARNFKSDSNKTLRRTMAKVYLDFEHWGLPFSVSYIPEYNMFMVSILCITLAFGSPPDV
jgi:hypothetical protein